LICVDWSVLLVITSQSSRADPLCFLLVTLASHPELIIYVLLVTPASHPELIIYVLLVTLASHPELIIYVLLVTTASDPELIVCALKTGVMVVFSARSPFRKSNIADFEVNIKIPLRNHQIWYSGNALYST
jgi:hypothetical protein